VAWTRREDGRTFQVKVYDEHRYKLISEVAAYYEPVSWETNRRTLAEDALDEHGKKDRRSRIQKARKARWQHRNRDPELWRSMPYTA
jgi:hypothetical protein